MKVKVWVSTKKAGSKCEDIIEVDMPDVDDETLIGAQVLDYIEQDMISWGWEPV